MIKVDITPRRSVYVELENDTKPNIGGYYCHVYGDNSHDFELDGFTIDKNVVRADTEEQKRSKAARIVKNEILLRYK